MSVFLQQGRSAESNRGVNTNNCWFNAWWTSVRMIQFWSLSWPTASWHITSPVRRQPRRCLALCQSTSVKRCPTEADGERHKKTLDNSAVSLAKQHTLILKLFLSTDVGTRKSVFICSGVMSQYLDRRLKLNANICTICKSFNTCAFCNMLTLTMCFVFVYRYGKLRGRGTGSSRIPRRRSRNTSAWHSLFPSTTGYLVQRRTQNPSQQSDVSLWICLGFFFPIPALFYLSFSFLYVIVFEGSL